MSMADRAAQFSPFAALTGHGAAISETARLTDRQIEKYTDYYRREVVLSVPMGPKTQKKEKHEHER